MIISQTFCSSSIGDLGGLAKLFSFFCGLTPVHSHTFLAKVDRFGRVSAFIPNTPHPSFLRLVKTRLGLAENPTNPRHHLVKRSDVPAFCLRRGAWHQHAQTWVTGHGECMTQRETHSWPLAAAVSFYKIVSFLLILG